MNRNAEKVFARIEQIPTFPENIKSVVDAIDRNDTSASDIAGMIETEPALAANVLKVANSAFYGFLGNVVHVREAVVLIGLREVRNLVLGTSVLRFFHGASQTGFNRMDLWRHSVVCAFLTKVMVQKASVEDPRGACMIGGLIHDIGKIVIDQYFPEFFTLILRKVREDGLTFSQAEKLIMGYTHYQIGAALMKRWNFPNELIAPVFYHHAPWHDTSYLAISATVYLSNLFSKALSYPSFKHELPYTTPWLKSPNQRSFFKKMGFPSTQEEVDLFLTNAEAGLVMECAGLFSAFSLAA